MNLTALLSREGARPVRFALTGAKGAYARTLLAQAKLGELVRPAVLCDLDVDGVAALCVELGYDPDTFVIASSADDVRAAGERIALVADLDLIRASDAEVLVEATGSPVHGTRASLAAIEDGRHVVMVSKEVDTVSGPALGRAANEAGVVYTLAHGDQPANLLDLIGWARTVGFDIVAAGKSSEYDLVYDPAAGTITQLDETHPVDTAEFEALLALGDVSSTLTARAAAVSTFTRSAAADLCEMTAVAAQTDLIADTELFHYPVARIAELADIYALRADGGILDGPGRVDVFSALRISGEPSFAGGEFVVVRTGDPATWETLRQKGHVISRDGRYACIFWPYHLMGVETVVTIAAAARLGVGTGRPGAAPRVMMAGRARHDLPAGTRLTMGGHHHEIEGVAPVVREISATPADTAPFYLAAHATLARAVVAGELIALADLADPEPLLCETWSTARDLLV
jgi:predicted homoserine dehydrogenase-like protein